MRKPVLLAAAVIFLAGAAWAWLSGPGAWESATFSLSNETGEHLVFERQIREGLTIMLLLELEPGAEGHLVLETPLGEEVIPGHPPGERDDPAEVEVRTTGVYRLFLHTQAAPAQTPSPRVEVYYRVIR